MLAFYRNHPAEAAVEVRSVQYAICALKEHGELTVEVTARPGEGGGNIGQISIVYPE